METTVREQAAWWVTELEDPSPAVRGRFAEWLRESPRHVEEFLLLDAMWREFGRVDGAGRIDLDRLIAQAKDAGNVVALQRREAPAPATGRARPVPGWAAALAVIGIGFAAALHWSRPMVAGAQAYTTAVGEQRAVKLPDGSFVYLNTASSIEVRFDARLRQIRLREGEALFQVARDASRPFRVLAGPTTVEAVGTRFNVYRRETGVTVCVIEGAVRLPEKAGGPARRLTAGEAVQVRPDGVIGAAPAADVQQSIAWRERRLVFSATPLREVVEQFNRYNTLKIRVEGQVVGERQLIGTFDADDPRSLAQFLAQEKGLVVESMGAGEAAELVIRAR